VSKARDERGGVLVMFALFLPVLLLFAALVLDVGHAFQVRRHLQASADAAALAAARELPNTASATSFANDYSASAGGRNENPNLTVVSTAVNFPDPVGAKVRVNRPSGDHRLRSPVPRRPAHEPDERGGGRNVRAGADGTGRTLGLQDDAGLHRPGRRDVPRGELLEARLFGQKSGHK
jgi:Putative Flp pilus-assembly TadE/G-like